VHLDCTQHHAFVMTDATLDRLVDIYKCKEIDNAATKVTYLEKIRDISHFCHTLEHIDAYFCQQSGCNGVTLASVCHEMVAILPEADDEAFRMPTFKEDMIHRAPHDGMFYQHDNMNV
jgi:hypothetical protein